MTANVSAGIGVSLTNIYDRFHHYYYTTSLSVAFSGLPVGFVVGFGWVVSPLNAVERDVHNFLSQWSGTFTLAGAIGASMVGNRDGGAYQVEYNTQFFNIGFTLGYTFNTNVYA